MPRWHHGEIGEVVRVWYAETVEDSVDGLRGAHEVRVVVGCNLLDAVVSFSIDVYERVVVFRHH